jgi:hypothetical protein
MAVLTCLLFTSLRGASGSIYDRTAIGSERTTNGTKIATEISLESADSVQELRSFEERCSAPGVLVCQGFDSPEEYRPAKYPDAGLYPAWDGAIRGVRDTSIKASGSASLRFEVPSHSAANASGYWKQPMGKEFREGSTFYVQFRQRFTKEMLKNNWGGTTWKQVIFHNKAATCGAVELTTVQYYTTGIPTMYTNCGGHSLFTNNGNPPTKLEQGDYNCWYGNYNAKDCFFYPAEEWVTFYYQISVGNWGKPNSTINAWVALDGKPYKQWIQMPNFVLEKDRPDEGFDTVTLLTYMTAKSAQTDHPVAYTWYDDLIISANSIALPSISSDKQNSDPTKH